MTGSLSGAAPGGALTPSQTVGPFFAVALSWPDGPFVVATGTPRAFWLRGRVLDGAGEPVPDALVESWQADPDGRFDHPDDPRGPAAFTGFRGFGRCPTDAQGRYGIHTVKPGPVPGPATDPDTDPGTGPDTDPGTDPGTLQAPHIDLSVFARGLLDRVVTRVYFPDEAAANAADPVLASVPEPARATLVAGLVGDCYVFDIRLQGDYETAFFSL